MAQRRSNGGVGKLRRLVSRTRRAVYVKYDEIVLLRKVLDTMPPPPAPDRTLLFETAKARHIPLIVGLLSRHVDWDPTKLVAGRMANGAGAALAFLGDELIGYVWWADVEVMPRVEPLLPIRHAIRLEPDDFYGFDLFIAPEHRGGGTATWFIANYEMELKRLGYRRMHSYALRSNRPSRWLFAIRGHETVRRVGSQRVLLSRFLHVDGSLYFPAHQGLKRLRE
jgi:GNAT superfamily N-acetyltransferase